MLGRRLDRNDMLGIWIKFESFFMDVDAYGDSRLSAFGTTAFFMKPAMDARGNHFHA